jgi:hypothetical protein
VEHWARYWQAGPAGCLRYLEGHLGWLLDAEIQDVCDALALHFESRDF